MDFGYTTSRQMITRSLFQGNLAVGGDDPQFTTLRTTSGERNREH